jgi:hypothetical protein
MAVKISEYEPRTLKLFERDEDDESWECPIPGMEEVWVRVMPPSWGVDRDRQQFVNAWHNEPRLSVFDVAEYEIALCYGGTNMVVLVPKRDANGKMTFITEDPGYETEMIKFDAQGQLPREDILSRLSKLPRAIVQTWHERVMEVAPTWNTRFRQ